jgi:hypothetical protein
MGVNNTKRVGDAQIQLVVRHPSDTVSMWDLWWAKYQWDSLYSNILSIIMSTSFGQVSALVFLSYTVDAM